MPFSMMKLPIAAKNLTDKQKEIFIAAANAALADGKEDGVAIAIGLAAAKKEKMNKSFVETLAELIEKHFGGTQEEVEPVVEVTKAVNEEQRRAMFVVLEPDVVDLQGDTYTEQEVEKACRSFNSHSMKANLFHRVETEKAVIEQSFITPSSFKLDDGRQIQKGTWLQWWFFPEGDDQSEQLWKMVKTGEINGVSIGARCKVEHLEDES